MNFKKGMNPKQEFLIHKKPEDYLSDNHLAKMVYEVVSTLNFEQILKKYSNHGQNAYNPAMMVRIIFYGYAIGVRSSRKMAKSCEERFDFLYLSDGLQPSHDRISDFRKDNFEELKDFFKEIVILASGLGMIKLGNLNVCIDGSKIKA